MEYYNRPKGRENANSQNNAEYYGARGTVGVGNGAETVFRPWYGAKYGATESNNIFIAYANTSDETRNVRPRR